MCLKKVSELKVAEKDIEVIKYLRPDILTSPFRGFQYQLNELVVLDDPLWSSSKREAKDGKWAQISYGFHSFKEKLVPDGPRSISWEDRSRRHDEWHQLTQVDGAKAFKAIIPAGTEYFEGEDDWGVPAYISQKLLVIEESK